MKKNIVKFGLKNSTYWPITSVSPDGVPTYGEPERIPGSVTLSMNPEESSEPFHADNVVYYISTSNNGYSGDLELALVPDKFKEDILGERRDINDVMIESGNDRPKEFAYAFEIDGDAHARRFLFPRCKAGRTAIEAETKAGNITPKTESISLNAIGRIDNTITKLFCDPDSKAYSEWFDKPYDPQFNSEEITEQPEETVEE